MTSYNNSIRNIAIIAHVDHGKTTLVDQMFKQSGLFRSNQLVSDRMMDSMDLERERGITISAKNCSIRWNDIRINILDTPGHADFGGEVERALMMVDGAILLVDAAEGPLPQTRFVLQKALDSNLKMIVVINKIDRQDARAMEVLNEVYDLFIDLDANEDQIDFPVLFAVGRDGVASTKLDEPGESLKPLFHTIIEKIPAPAYEPDKPFQMMVLDTDFSDYLGKLAIGRVFNGSAGIRDKLVYLNENDSPKSLSVSKLQIYSGLTTCDIQIAEPGDIIILAGADQVKIGDTICTKDDPSPLKRVNIDEPTISMTFGVNKSPDAGQDGKKIQGNRIWERLEKESMKNVAIQVEKAAEKDTFIVKGRGEFQMAILIETMRREGYELLIGRPRVVEKEVNGVMLEPIEHLFIDCGEDFVGVVTEKLSKRKGRLTNMVNHGTGRVRMEFSIPARSLIGYRNEFLTDTRGTGIMNSYLEGYEPFRGEFPTRISGSLVADRQGSATGYALYNLEPRGNLFIKPGTPVYEGLIVGEHNRTNDLDVNICKDKKLTNMRASGSDDAIQLTPILRMTLEKAIDFIREDERIEVTPNKIQLRKKILRVLDRKRA